MVLPTPPEELGTDKGLSTAQVEVHVPVAGMAC